MSDTKDLTKQVIEAAFNHVFTDFDKYVRAIAEEHTVANMGQDLQWLIGEPKHYVGREDRVFGVGYQSLFQECESDDMARGLQDELKSWLKTAKRDANKVKKAGLPWTVQNARDFFDGKRK